ncbi:hypothetical protein LZA78_00775 [Sinirhodobacter sp. WL0062]|uniref:Flp family type IVb pilin n=1 Tax=Rhodobacter flavimaris TaxID=2907145 RepID=A0ABS8YRF9_9RHOB|nr:hypothetical protein [Sinirhodobacter sp. WL0062]MCE5972023.1 hypothetical protein [Sinirhodobacter sp. WL0062]
MTNVRMTKFRCLALDDSGATLVEYAIALIIAITVGAALLGGLGQSVSAKFSSANAQFTQ